MIHENLNYQYTTNIDTILIVWHEAKETKKITAFFSFSQGHNVSCGKFLNNSQYEKNHLVHLVSGIYYNVRMHKNTTTYHSRTERSGIGDKRSGPYRRDCRKKGKNFPTN